MRYLSIVMPALTGRLARCGIAYQLHEQTSRFGDEVEFLAFWDNGALSTGAKLRLLYSACKGAYICGVGDDDRVEPDYVATLLDAVKTHDVDLVTFDHSYSVNGKYVALTHQIPGCQEFQHPAGSDGIETHDRLPGPLCPVRADIVRAFDAPDCSDGEDAMFKEYLKLNADTHYGIDRVLYHHLWVSYNKQERAALRSTWGRQ